MKNPTEPPLLSKLQARKDELEEKRAELFTRWKAALSASKGNITRASIVEFGKPEDMSITRAKAYGMWLTRALGLREFAESLRVKSGQKEKGRPKWTTKKNTTP